MLEGKNAIVTGVSKGIGLEIAKSLLEKGVKVSGWSRSKPWIEHESFYYEQVDVSKWDRVNAAYQRATEIIGDIHFLINNAGFGVFGPMEELDNETWKEMFEVNVHGLYYCSKVVIPRMKEMDQGHIVNISSIAGLNPVKMAVGYSATKHAVTGMSHSMYMELRDFGIKVTCVYPGSTNTSFFDLIDDMQPNENMMRPEDVAKSVVDLLDSSANYLPVDLEIRPLRPKGKPQG